LSRDQILTVVLLVCLVGLFLWDRLRYDLVALLALLAAIACGVVPADKTFNGFSNQVLPLIAGALIVSVAIGQSGAIEVLLRWLTPLMRSKNLQVGVLVACVAVLSAFMKNIGALAIFISAAVQVARRNNRSPSEFLMPLSFASLFGGSMTLVGTSPNLLASAVRQELTGQPFHMFDFMPVGAGIALIGTVFLSFGWRLLPRGRRGAAAAVNFTIEDYTSEVRVPEKSPFIGRTVGEIEKAGGGEIAIAAVIRDSGRRQIPTARWKLHADDVLVIEAEPQALEQFARDGNLELVGADKAPERAPEKVLELAAQEARVKGPASDDDLKTRAPERAAPDERPLSIVEAVIAAGSDLIGRSAATLHLRERYGVNVLAIGRRGRLRSTRLRQTRFKLGDAIVLQGHTGRLPDILVALGCLPLAERPLNLGRRRQLVLPLLILAAAIALSGLELVPPAIAFVGAAVARGLFGLVSLKEAYGAVEFPILVLIGALIPIGEAVQQNGTAKVIATALGGTLAHMPSYAIIAALLGATMLVTPILHHAAAVLVMGPIAASLAQQLGYKIDPFLMAVAFGAGSDFLSPIGHQSNTLVMGLGGYRFGDYWKLGLPLSLLVLVLGTPLILLFWPVH
jgi:di/tricarboxylate transporter